MSPHVAQGCLDPAAPHGSAYRGAPAAHTRARELVGVAESDPDPTCRSEPIAVRDAAPRHLAEYGQTRLGALAAILMATTLSASPGCVLLSRCC
jgi:hypothetical protein